MNASSSPPYNSNLRTQTPALTPNVTLITDVDELLDGLNDAQREAVLHDPMIPLQILAGPGSGKTKVLTTRITRLILTHKLLPKTICAVTFTNKAANEMRDRLTKLIGKQKTTALQMGTFHSLCAKYLRQYFATVDLKDNFTICDADDSKKLITELMKPYANYMADKDITLTEGTVASQISKAKAKGQSASAFFEEVEKADKAQDDFKRNHGIEVDDTKSLLRILAEVYIGYEKVLKDNNALDFDDLLIYGVKLFSNTKESVLWCRHILVDEFQDTNTMQYELMKALAIRNCLTIVGDPDQSIYGWRSAQVVNLSKMRKDFPDTQQIFLEQNYRSTASILRSSLAIISEDKNRIPKSLIPSHPLGSTPGIGKFLDEKQEAAFIAREIKRCVANMGGVLKWSDFVILLRYNALSRPIETALQMEGIPCRILAGHKFFERMEVKDLLAFLQLTDNPSFNPSFVRALKLSSVKLGEKRLAAIATQAEIMQITQLELVERIHDNKTPDTKPPIKKNLGAFVKVIRTLREQNEENVSPADIIRKLVIMIDYEKHLRDTQQDWESRWENVQELITFATEVEIEIKREAEAARNRNPANREEEKNSILRTFLQNSMLSSEGDNDTDESSPEKVTLSTCHSAKGLEWPVVMIPSVDARTFPFYRTEDVDEDRRLLYVACTRAQALLYILFAEDRTVGGKKQVRRISDFVGSVQEKNEGLFSFDVPRFLPDDRGIISNILDRPLPDEAEIERMITELKLNGEHVQPVFQKANGLLNVVDLDGVKTSNAREDILLDQGDYTPLYGAPDVLASISASFQMDHKKAPFRKNAKHASRQSAPAMTLGTPHATHPLKPPPFSAKTASNSGKVIHPSQNNIYDRDIPPVVASSRQGSSSRQIHANHPEPQTFNQNASSPRPGRSINISTPPSTYSRTSPLRPSTVNSIRFSQMSTPPIQPFKKGPVSEPRWSSSTATESWGRPDENSRMTTVHVSRKSKLKAPSSTFSNYDQDHPRGESSCGPNSSATLTKEANSPRDMTSCESFKLPVPSTATPPRNTTEQQMRRPSVVPNLPSEANSSPRMEIEHSRNSQASPAQVAGVKRRLGMGRITVGYSNKKFKQPAA